MYCSNCGTLNPVHTKKCSKCGLSLVKKNLFCKISTAINIVIVVLILLFIVCQLPCTRSMQDRAIYASVYENMNHVMLSAEYFAKWNGGLYPISQESHVKNGTVTFESILHPRKTGVVFHNPVSRDQPEIIVLSDSVTVKEILKKGQVGYLPITIQKEGAKSYIIYGKGPKMLVENSFISDSKMKESNFVF